eukprot:3875473-Rhodomonas_salina.2
MLSSIDHGHAHEFNRVLVARGEGHQSETQHANQHAAAVTLPGLPTRPGPTRGRPSAAPHPSTPCTPHSADKKATGQLRAKHISSTAHSSASSPRCNNDIRPEMKWKARKHESTDCDR